MKTVKIVWNGCDGYSLGDKSVFTQHEEFKPFDVIEVDVKKLPIIDGEIDFDGVFGVESNGKFYNLP
jgi:hypothetical protein